MPQGTASNSAPASYIVRNSCGCKQLFHVFFCVRPQVGLSKNVHIEIYEWNIMYNVS